MNGNTNWVFMRTDRDYGLVTVGFYDPNGKWHPEGDYDDTEKAAERVHYLNGGEQKKAAGL